MELRLAKRRKTGRFFMAAILFTIALLGLLTMINRIFEIKTIEMVGEGIELQIDQRRFVKNLLLFPAEQIAKDIQKKEPLLARVTIRKKYPHTLLIEAFPRIPLVRWQTPTQQLLLDEEGVVLGDVTPGKSELPLLTETMPKAAVIQALTFVKLTRTIITVTEISLFDGGSLRAKTGKTEILFPQQGELPEKAATLQTLINGFRIKGILPKTVDLRFEKPIIIF